jgi:lipoate-protein ligase A
MEDFNPHYNFRRMIAIVEEIKEAFKVDDKYLEKKDFENYLKILTEEYEKNKKK